MSAPDPREPPGHAGLLAPGAIIAGRYRVRRVHAVGGMGVIYQAVSLVDREAYAIKALLPDLCGDDGLVRRFAREAAAMKLLDHGHLVHVAETLVWEHNLYLVMELVVGPTLDRLGAGGALPVRRAIELAAQILDALDHAHASGVIHRDLKPENVVVTAREVDGRTVDHVKVLDFGVAKVVDTAARLVGAAQLTQAGFTQGTPEYMAPEQAVRGTPVDHRADLYALGVILFELLAGVRPFAAPDRATLMRKHVYDPPPRLVEVAPWRGPFPPALEVVVGRALAKLPADRYASAAAMRTALWEAVATI